MNLMATNENEIKPNGGAEPAILSNIFSFTNEEVPEEQKAEDRRKYVPAPEPGVMKLVHFKQVGEPGQENFRPARTILRIDVELAGPDAKAPVIGDEWIAFSEFSNFGRPKAVTDTETEKPIRLNMGGKFVDMLATLKLIVRNPNAPKKDAGKK